MSLTPSADDLRQALPNAPITRVAQVMVPQRGGGLKPEPRLEHDPELCRCEDCTFNAINGEECES